MTREERQLLRERGYRWQLVSPTGEIVTVPEALRRAGEQAGTEEDSAYELVDPKWREARDRGMLRWLYIGDRMYCACYWNTDQQAWLTSEGLDLAGGGPNDYDAIWRPEHGHFTWDRERGSSPPWSRDDVNSASPMAQLMDLVLHPPQ
jgi:hypothetical protein